MKFNHVEVGRTKKHIYHGEAVSLSGPFFEACNFWSELIDPKYYAPADPTAPREQPKGAKNVYANGGPNAEYCAWDDNGRRRIQLMQSIFPELNRDDISRWEIGYPTDQQPWPYDYAQGSFYYAHVPVVDEKVLVILDFARGVQHVNTDTGEGGGLVFYIPNDWDNDINKPRIENASEQARNIVASRIEGYLHNKLPATVERAVKISWREKTARRIQDFFRDGTYEVGGQKKNPIKPSVSHAGR